MTSSKTEQQAKELGIPLKAIDDVESVDLTIDGTDEISDDFQESYEVLHCFRKSSSNLFQRLHLDRRRESKMVNKLGNFPYQSK